MRKSLYSIVLVFTTITKDLTQSLNAGDTQFANKIGYPLRLNKCQENIQIKLS